MTKYKTEWNNRISQATKGHFALKFLKNGLFVFGTRAEKIGVKKYTGKETSLIIAIIVVASEGYVFFITINCFHY